MKIFFEKNFEFYKLLLMKIRGTNLVFYLTTLFLKHLEEILKKAKNLTMDFIQQRQ